MVKEKTSNVIDFAQKKRTFDNLKNASEIRTVDVANLVSGMFTAPLHNKMLKAGMDIKCEFAKMTQMLENNQYVKMYERIEELANETATAIPASFYDMGQDKEALELFMKEVYMDFEDIVSEEDALGTYNKPKSHPRGPAR